MGKTRINTARQVLPLLTVREAREVYRCSRSTVYRWLDRGRLQKVGNVPGQDEYQDQSVLLLQVVDDELVERLEEWTERRAKRGKPVAFLSERLDIRTIGDLAAAVRAAAERRETPPPEPEEPRLPPEIAALLDRLSEESKARGELLTELERVQRERDHDTRELARTIAQIAREEQQVFASAADIDEEQLAGGQLAAEQLDEEQFADGQLAAEQPDGDSLDPRAEDAPAGEPEPQTTDERPTPDPEADSEEQDTSLDAEVMLWALPDDGANDVDPEEPAPRADPELSEEDPLEAREDELLAPLATQPDLAAEPEPVVDGEPTGSEAEVELPTEDEAAAAEPDAEPEAEPAVEAQGLGDKEAVLWGMPGEPTPEAEPAPSEAETPDEPAVEAEPATAPQGLGDKEAVLWGMPGEPTPEVVPAPSEAETEDAPAVEAEPSAASQGLGDKEAVLWGMPGEPTPEAEPAPTAPAAEPSAASQGLGDKEAVLWGMPGEPTPEAEPAPTAPAAEPAAAPQGLGDKEAVLWGMPGEATPEAEPAPTAPAAETAAAPKGLGDKEAVLWGMPGEDPAPADQPPPAEKPQGLGAKEAVLWGMPGQDDAESTSLESFATEGEAPAETVAAPAKDPKSSIDTLWGRPTAPTPAEPMGSRRPAAASATPSAGVVAAPELVQCLERIATAAGGTREAVESISARLGAGATAPGVTGASESSDTRIGGLFLASGCATLALTWAAALQQRFPEGRIGLLVLLAANFVASAVILIGRQRMRRS